MLSLAVDATDRVGSEDRTDPGSRGKMTREPGVGPSVREDNTRFGP